MGSKERKGKRIKSEPPRTAVDEHWWADDKDFETWLEGEPATEFEPDDHFYVPQLPIDATLKKRLDQIRESHSLLRQFTPKELKILMSLKRNTSPKAWTMREDLVVLTVPMSNREIAEILQDRNKEAVKKRLQLLRSKGLTKRQPLSAIPESCG